MVGLWERIILIKNTGSQIEKSESHETQKKEGRGIKREIGGMEGEGREKDIQIPT